MGLQRRGGTRRTATSNVRSFVDVTECGVRRSATTLPMSVAGEVFLDRWRGFDVV